MEEQSEYLLVEKKPINNWQKFKKLFFVTIFVLVIVAFIIEIVLIAIKYFSTP